MIAGPISDRIGIQSWFFLGGTLCILMGAAGFFIPAVMNIESRRVDIIDTQDSNLPAPISGD
jgi:hypothetical protein